MYFKTWYQERGPGFVSRRAISLLERYGMSTIKAVNRIESVVSALADYGCAPTFPTPGIVVERHPDFILRLQDNGAEIANHGYQHIELNHMPLSEAMRRITMAVRVFEQHGIQGRGFRSPYTAATDELLNAMPEHLFDYSSNSVINWDLHDSEESTEETAFCRTLCMLYDGANSDQTVSLPWRRHNLIEIPVSIPDDILLRDGLTLDARGIARKWIGILRETHRRGELFTLMFHPELCDYCEPAFRLLLPEARQMSPGVWIAKLQDVCDWWKEKSNFTVETLQESSCLRVVFNCSERATILARGLETNGIGMAWDERYRRLQGYRFDLPAEPCPFVGVENANPSTLSFLRDQGYIVETGESAARCAIHIDKATLAQLTNQIQLIDYIEMAPGPLIRLWRWPNGFKSAMCITGDLDALSLLDYATRLLIR